MVSTSDPADQPAQHRPTTDRADAAPRRPRSRPTSPRLPRASRPSTTRPRPAGMSRRRAEAPSTTQVPTTVWTVPVGQAAAHPVERVLAAFSDPVDALVVIHDPRSGHLRSTGRRRRSPGPSGPGGSGGLANQITPPAYDHAESTAELTATVMPASTEATCSAAEPDKAPSSHGASGPETRGSHASTTACRAAVANARHLSQSQASSPTLSDRSAPFRPTDEATPFWTRFLESHPLPAGPAELADSVDRSPSPAGQLDPSSGTVLARHGLADDEASAARASRYELVVADLGCGAATDELGRAMAALVAPGGTLAVLTHSHRTGGVLVDPMGSVVAAAQNADLLYLQHIVLITGPLLAAANPAEDGAAHQPAAVGVLDLALFTRPEPETPADAEPAAPPPQQPRRRGPREDTAPHAAVELTTSERPR